MSIYFLSERGKIADPKDTPAGRVIAHMQESKDSDFNPDRIAYALGLDAGQVRQVLDSLMRAGLVVKESDEEFGEGPSMEPPAFG